VYDDRPRAIAAAWAGAALCCWSVPRRVLIDHVADRWAGRASLAGAIDRETTPKRAIQFRLCGGAAAAVMAGGRRSSCRGAAASKSPQAGAEAQQLTTTGADRVRSGICYTYCSAVSSAGISLPFGRQHAAAHCRPRCVVVQARPAKIRPAPRSMQRVGVRNGMNE
jgi:hypothetical protein